jgi:hypothetical protein
LYKGIQKLIAHSKTSKAESVELDQKINILKKDVSKRKDIAQSRIKFNNRLPVVISFFLGPAGAGVSAIISSVFTTTTATTAAGGICGGAAAASGAFPLLLPIIVGVAIGTISLGAILFLISKLWERRQIKAIQYLTQILEKLNK